MSKTTAVVLGSVLGVLLITSLFALLYIVWRGRRRDTRQRNALDTLRNCLQRRESLNLSGSPILLIVATYTETLFTSSESIMRNNPTNPSAVDHKDGNTSFNSPNANTYGQRTSAALTVTSKSSRFFPPGLPPDIPVYRTFAEFDAGFNFPVAYRTSSQMSGISRSPNTADDRKDSVLPRLPSGDGV